jgi:hypothetical protein
MDIYNQLQKYLEDRKAFSNEIPDIIQRTMDTISQNASYDLKLIIALTELVVTAGHFHKHLQLPEGTLVPTNTISFVLAGSGRSKDSSVQQCRRAFKPIYEYIEEQRLHIAEDRAMKEAIADGKEQDWYKYFKEPTPLVSTVGTAEGLARYAKELELDKYGSVYVLVSELSSELTSSPVMKQTLESISKLYDLGILESKVIKNDESRVSSIKGVPTSALLYGSTAGLLYNQKTKEVFIDEFTNRIARRSFIVLDTQKQELQDYTSIEELHKQKKEVREKALEAVKELQDYFSSIVESITKDPVVLSTEAEKLLDIYQEYNTYTSELIDNKYPLAKLARLHSHWKSVKLATALTVLYKEEEILEEYLLEAIRITEKLADNMLILEKELQKEMYELFISYCYEYDISEIELHTIKKLGFITPNGKPIDKLNDLALLANSADDKSIYTVDGTSIVRQELKPVNTIGISYKEVEGSKDQRAKQCNDGFAYIDVDFSDLSEILQGDYA